jgi:serine/threonine-protein kinase
MAGAAQVLGLLEQMLDAGKTPEEVCHDHPELLAEVRRRWQEFHLVDDQIGALLPGLHSSPRDNPITPTLLAAALPLIPGYDVQSVLGSGGMGVVYKARQIALDRQVAVKMLIAGSFASQQELGRFHRETATLAGLQHSNIVQVYDAGEVDSRPYFAMELVEGGSLSQKLAGTPQPAQRAAELLLILAQAIDVAHRSGIVHRDLKPANILLAADGMPKITDFGLARRLNEEAGLTRSGAALGTPSYMSPEQARGNTDSVGPAADVYALGAILYELLTGRPPFRGATDLDTVQQVTAREPVPPSRLNHAVPRDLETICLKCLRKEPGQRYGSAAGLAEDIDRFLRGETITARPTGRVERLAKWARRRPAAAVLLAAAVLMFAGVIAAAGWYVDHRARLRSEEEARATRINGLANAALDQAEGRLMDLRVRLDDPLRVHELLSDIDQWQIIVMQARRDRDRADLPIRGNETLVTDQTRERLRAVEAAVAKEEIAFDLAKDLDEIQAQAYGPSRDQHSHIGRAAASYANFFSRLDLDIQQDDKVYLKSAIKSSPIRFALVAGLDHWAGFAAIINSKDPQLPLLLELARAADPDPWRDRFRDPTVWNDRAALTALAAEVNVERQSPTILASLGLRLNETGASPTALYNQAVLCHPRDFWLHLNAAIYAKEPWARIGLNLAACAIRPNNPGAYSNLSVYLLANGDTRGALTAANKAKAIDPNCVAAHINIGRVLLENQNLPGAIAASQKAIELDPKSAVAHSNLGVALWQSKDLTGAVAACKKAIELDPKHAAAHINLGAALRDSGDLPGAVTALKKAIELNPKSAKAHSNLGSLLRESKDLSGAIAACKKAIELDPKSAAAHSHLGVALRDSKDAPGAVAAFKKVIELEPKSAPANVNLGLALIDSKDMPGAAAAFKKAIELDPTCAQAYGSLGGILLAQGDSAGAVVACKKAVELDPKSALAYTNLGIALGQGKDYPGAVAACTKAIELDAARFQAHYGLGLAHQCQGHYADAELAYLAAIKAQPAFVPANNALALLLSTCSDDKVRDGKRAVEYATMACKLTGWKEPRYQATLAAAYAEAGQFEEAVRYQTRVLDDPALQGDGRTAAEQRLELYRQKKPWREQ